MQTNDASTPSILQTVKVADKVADKVAIKRTAGKHLTYTNHILQRTQELMFHSPYEEGIARLFLMLNKVAFDNSSGDFSFFDRSEKLWKVYKNYRASIESLLTVSVLLFLNILRT